MKKVLALAAAAMMAFSVQAVTTGWTEVTTETTRSSAGHKDLCYSVAANGNGTVAALVTYSGTIGTGTVLAASKGAQYILSIGIDEDGNYVIGSDKATLTTTTKVAASGQQILGIAFHRKNGTVMGDIEFSVDGVVIGTASGTPISTGPMSWTVWGKDRNDTAATLYSGSATYDVWAINQKLDAATIKSDITAKALPEPTVVALLALGVAGLALKRKVA